MVNGTRRSLLAKHFAFLSEAKGLLDSSLLFIICLILGRISATYHGGCYSGIHWVCRYFDRTGGPFNTGQKKDVRS